MEHSTFLKSPKKEQKEEEEENEGHTSGCISKPHSIEDEVIMDDELEGILGIEDIETNPSDVVARGIDSRNYLQVNWEDEFSTAHLFQDPEFWHLNGDEFGVKSESRCEHWDFDDRKASLHLNLNYQEVLKAWSNRGSLWAPSNSYNGEVPVMEEERGVWSRRQASVMRYKEKRQSRLFSKKIRYEVRKLNADKRPRIKGRFVKRLDDKMQNGS